MFQFVMSAAILMLLLCLEFVTESLCMDQIAHHYKESRFFLENFYDKGYCTQRIFADDILQAEDQRLLQSIMCNVCHPLHEYFMLQPKDRTTRHGVSFRKPKTKTKTFKNSFCVRVLLFS